MAAVNAPFPVIESSQVGQVRRAAVRLAEASDFPEQARGEIAVVATELATNLARYGRAGQFFLQPIADAGETAIQLLAIDSGPGIADVRRSLEDGVSTGGTPGTGLGAVRRMSHQFDIYSLEGQGTVVMSLVGKRRARKESASRFQCAAISTAAPGESVSGDAWRILEQDGRLAVMVADGLGHGVLAAEAADRAAALFEESRFADPPAAYCENAHRALVGSRGAALACAHVSPVGQVAYTSVGNVMSTIISGDTARGLPSQNGTVGLQMRRMQTFEANLPERGVFVMHSDGLTNRWSTGAYVGLWTRHPAVIAGVLYRDCLRGKDDATIVVIKRVEPR